MLVKRASPTNIRGGRTAADSVPCGLAVTAGHHQAQSWDPRPPWPRDSAVSAVLAPLLPRTPRVSQPPSPPRPTGPPPPPALLEALAAARGTPWQRTDAFHAALCAYVGELRADGLDPVDMLLAVKATLHGVPPSLLEQSVTWCIEAYYRAA